VVRFNLAIGTTVLVLWAAIGGARPFQAVHHHWSVSLTMVFGSLAGGGTSEGGGAVSFPVFTKLLHVPANEARIFTYAIQSIGMGCASLSILYVRLPIEKRILFYAAPAGVAGVILSSTRLAPSLGLPEIRIYFTVLPTSLALALLILRARRVNDRNLRIPRFGPGEAAILIATGFLGGVLSGLVGVGREHRRVHRPGHALPRLGENRHTHHRDPHGGRIDGRIPLPCGHHPRLHSPDLAVLARGRACRRPRGALITADLTSTLIMIHIPTATRIIGALLLLVVTSGCLALTRVSRYAPPRE
jgi:uncharacterized membrane protein YfcA